jgi:TonB family protein
MGAPVRVSGRQAGSGPILRAVPRRDERMPPSAVLLLFGLAASANLAAGFGAHEVIRRGGGGTLPRGNGSFMEVSLLDEALPEKEEELAAESPPMEKKLVRLDRVVRERAPKDAKHIAEFDNDPERPTASPLARGPLGAPTPSTAPGRTAHEMSESERPNDAAGAVGEGSAADPANAAEADDGILGEQGAGRQNPDLKGSSTLMRQTFGDMGARELVEEADEGSEMVPGTKRHEFASFFNRVRDSIARHWSPNDVMRSHDPTGKIYGRRDRHTLLRIRLFPDGALSRVWIIRSSGLDVLDEEAVRSVRSAAPFVNPPEGLVDAQSGTIEFRFGFTLFNGQARLFRVR